MARLLFLTFFGEFRGGHDAEHHVHESPWSMLGPLVLLAIGSVAGRASVPTAASGSHVVQPAFRLAGGGAPTTWPGCPWWRRSPASSAS